LSAVGTLGGCLGKRGASAVVWGLVTGLAACFGSGADPPMESGTVSVLTYNVSGLPQEVSQTNPRVNIPLMSPLLNAYDVVVTQEDYDWWRDLANFTDFVHYHEQLRAQATHPYRSPAHPGLEGVGLDLTSRPDVQVGDGLGVLSRYPLRGSERIPWNSCYGGWNASDLGAFDCLAVKGFLRSTLILADGVEVDLYVIHAESGGSDPDQRLQADDFQELGDYVERQSAGRAVLVAGDTNLHTDASHPDAEGVGDTIIWTDFLNRLDLSDACTATVCEHDDLVDKIAYRSGGHVELSATTYEVPSSRFRDTQGEGLSDHEPIVVRLHWEANG
jgi:endonuclease/exonuclease/phosphatase family metal-dependent hydrolase